MGQDSQAARKIKASSTLTFGMNGVMFHIIMEVHHAVYPKRPCGHRSGCNLAGGVEEG
jgi:hypothetical protein